MKQPEMRDECDFSKGVRGKYAAKAREGCNVVRQDDDVAAIFHDSKQVNGPLRSIAHLVQQKG